MKLYSILFYCVFIVNSVKGQRMLKLKKPIVDLLSKPVETTTPKLPEERRRLSIFPKSKMKYIVTNPYSQVRSYSPWEMTTKKPLVQKNVPKELNNLKSSSVATRRPIPTKFSNNPPINSIPKIKDTEKLREVNNNNVEISNINTIESSTEINHMNIQFVDKDMVSEAQSADEIMIFSSSTNNEISKQTNNPKAQIIDDLLNSESDGLDLENSRMKRLSKKDLNNFDQTASTESYSLEEQLDYNEFIFINTFFNPFNSIANPIYNNIEEDVEITTDVNFFEESTKSQAKRSVNVLEEENLGTTISGFKFTGREEYVNGHLVFNNINV